MISERVAAVIVLANHQQVKTDYRLLITDLSVYPISDSTEWLEADGLGGFASGTTSGVRTRRYHALLLTATTPPTGRVVLVNGFDAWIETANGTFALSSQHYTPDVVHPDGARHIE